MNVNCIIMAQFTIMQLCLRKRVYVNKGVTFLYMCAQCLCKRVYVNKGVTVNVRALGECKLARACLL